jgi:hypothetical protein
MIYHIEIDLNFSVIQYSSKDARGGRQVVLATVLEWWVSSAGGGGVSGVVGMLTMRRLKAPARHKPGIEQHQRRALWPPLRETASYLQNRAAGKPLCGRFGAGQSNLTGTGTGGPT